MKEIRSTIESRSLLQSGHGIVHWKTIANEDAQAPASRGLLARNLYAAPPVRVGNHYPRQLNYHGWYLFSQTGKHVWTESRLETRSLMFLDMFTDVVAMAAQPMRIEFDDGTIHFPDFMALHGNGRQMVYDVKPRERINDKALEQFARTQALCTRVGWGYQILVELEPQQRDNVTYLSHFKHPGFRPDDAAISRLLASLDAPSSFLEAARALEIGSLPAARSALLHLLWGGVVITDISLRLNDQSIIERNQNANR